MIKMRLDKITITLQVCKYYWIILSINIVSYNNFQICVWCNKTNTNISYKENLKNISNYNIL